jgi:hypothetical protein
MAGVAFGHVAKIYDALLVGRFSDELHFLRPRDGLGIYDAA